MTVCFTLFVSFALLLLGQPDKKISSCLKAGISNIKIIVLPYIIKLYIPEPNQKKKRKTIVNDIAL